MTMPDRARTTNKYARLPEPVKPEDMVTSLDVEPVPEQKDDRLRELEWLLRTSG
jgi:hypothetical protein